jgi:hypothetical protein
LSVGAFFAEEVFEILLRIDDFARAADPGLLRLIGFMIQATELKRLLLVLRKIKIGALEVFYSYVYLGFLFEQI